MTALLRDPERQAQGVNATVQRLSMLTDDEVAAKSILRAFTGALVQPMPAITRLFIDLVPFYPYPLVLVEALPEVCW